MTQDDRCNHLVTAGISLVLFINVFLMPLGFAADTDRTNRIIVKFKPAAAISPSGAPTSQPFTLRARVSTMSARLGMPIQYRRTLATGAEVVELDAWKSYDEAIRCHSLTEF